MDSTIITNQAKAAKMLLVVLLVSILGNMITFFQTENQLVSPLIPDSVVLTIVRPYLIAAVIGTIGSIAALLFYFYSKYLITIILCSVSIIGQQVYYQLN